MNVSVGGNFTVLIDASNRAFVWGSNTNNEIGTGDSNPKLYPSLLNSIEDK